MTTLLFHRQRGNRPAAQLIKIAVLAIGGQGGGVVSKWIVELAESQSWRAQATSVPGVAQRTGATIYYVELAPPEFATPVFAMMPTPGDVDIVIAAELMEAGRAIQRGLVTPDRTVLIASSHRNLAIAEKSAPGAGFADGDAVHRAAKLNSKSFHVADMEAIAREHGTVISAALFGALARSKALPFSTETFEAIVMASAKGANASLGAFKAASSGHRTPPARTLTPGVRAPQGPLRLTRAFAELEHRISTSLPQPAQAMARAGLRKVVDFQDVRYGREYLDRLCALNAFAPDFLHAEHDYALLREGAKYIANAMTYDDVIRVADLKIRTARFDRIARAAKQRPGQIITITEFMHPGAEEVCGLLPAHLGRWLYETAPTRRLIDRVVNRGRRVRTDTLVWFLGLKIVASLRRWRRGLRRHEMEQSRLEDWLRTIRQGVYLDYELGVEIVRCQRLIKGYSETFARSHRKYNLVLSALRVLGGREDAAAELRGLREAALADEEGQELAQRLSALTGHQ